jgi:RNA polymerase-binding transcription factor DksA
MNRHCKVCDVVIDPRRIAILPETKTCTQHSTAEKKVAMVVQMGEGDHTWTETYAVEREVYDKIQEAEKNFRKTTNPTPKPKSKLVEEEDESLELDAIELEDSDLPFEDEVNEFIDDESDYSKDDILEEE